MFLPTVGKYATRPCFLLRLHGTLLHHRRLFLPETKGKTLEEIEAHFEEQDVRSAALSKVLFSFAQNLR